MSKIKKISLLELLGEGTQNNVWIRIGSRTRITNVDFHNKEIVVTSHFSLSCGCCTESDWETFEFSDLEENVLDLLIEELK
jgi:hypothetical protein